MLRGADRLRPEWLSLPSGLRARIVEAIGGNLISDRPAQGGFGVGYAGIVRTTTGRAFVKAVSSSGHEESRRLLRRELSVLRAMPHGLAPEIRLGIDDHDGTALVIDPIDGEHPGEPWTGEQLDRIAATMARLAATTAPASLPDATEALIPRYTRWREIEGDDALRRGLPPAIAARLADLVEVERSFTASIAGGAVMHNDLRADNVLLRSGEAHFLDWPHALRAAPWADLPLLLPSVESDGGPRCEDAWPIFQEHGAPDPEALLPVIAGFASFLWHGQAQPELPEIPGLRRFQRVQATAAIRWLDTLL